jgi:hypothetical protein
VKIRKPSDKILAEGTPPMPSSFKDPPQEQYMDPADKDYEEVMHGQPPQPQQQPLHPPEVPPQGSKAEHPLLQQLRSDLGITHNTPSDKEIGGHTWSMLPVNQQLFGVASRIVEDLAMGTLERLSMMELAIASVAVVAIDGKPIYEVFGIDTQETIRDPMRPPVNVHVRAASAFFDFLNTDAKQELGTKLHGAYVDTWDKHGLVQSYLDDDGAQWTWICPDDDCDVMYKQAPRRDDEGAVQSMYCKYHGNRMTAISQGDEDENPLP